MHSLAGAYVRVLIETHLWVLQQGHDAASPRSGLSWTRGLHMCPAPACAAHHSTYAKALCLSELTITLQDSTLRCENCILQQVDQDWPLAYSKASHRVSPCGVWLHIHEQRWDQWRRLPAWSMAPASFSAITSLCTCMCQAVQSNPKHCIVNLLSCKSASIGTCEG